MNDLVWFIQVKSTLARRRRRRTSAWQIDRALSPGSAPAAAARERATTANTTKCPVWRGTPRARPGPAPHRAHSLTRCRDSIAVALWGSG